MYQRSILQKITKRIFEPRKFIQVLVGPRQVGKTTLVKQFLQQNEILHHFVSGDNMLSSDTSSISREWNIARHKMQQNSSAEILLIIDEVQKIQNWSEQVKKEWDADSFSDLNVKLLLLGSSRLLLQKGLTESLTGRYELMNVTHWSFDEMRDAFDFSLDEYIYFGGYPGAATLISDEERWRNYVRES